MKSGSSYNLRNLLLILGIIVAIFVGISSIKAAKTSILKNPPVQKEAVTKNKNTRLINQYGNQMISLLRKMILEVENN